MLPEWDKEFHIRTDASGIAVGAVLYQIDDCGMEHPISYHSKSLTKAEKNWSTTEKGVIRHRSRQVGSFHRTAPTTFTSILTTSIKIYQETTRSERKIARWLCELENFEYEIHYIRGKDNFDADYLSRNRTYSR